MRRIPFLLVTVTGALLLLAVPAFATTAKTAASPPVNTALPTIAGTAQQGQTLTAANGTWTGVTPIAYTYEWQSCSAAGSGCKSINKATSQNYVTSKGDVNGTIRVAVTGTNADGKSEALSAATAKVIDTTVVPPAPKPTNPVNTTLPAITGTKTVGQTLSASSGVWTGNTGPSFGFQWSRCSSNGTGCANVLGATGQTYGIRLVDLNMAIRVNVTASNKQGTTTASSAASMIGGALFTAKFNAVLRTGQEPNRPVGTTSRTAGHYTATVKGKTLKWTLTFTNLTGRPTVTHLNKGVRGTTGIAFKSFCFGCSAPSHGTQTLTASQLDAMVRGKAYVNVMTKRNRAGEIRGQIGRVS